MTSRAGVEEQGGGRKKVRTERTERTLSEGKYTADRDGSTKGV
jgi:hypothetical protein